MRFRRFAAVLLLASTCSAGTFYTTEMTRPSGVVTFKTWTKEKSIKTVVVSSTDRSMPEGFFVISRDAGQTLIAGVPGKKQFVELTHEQFLNMNAAKIQQQSRIE